MVVNAVMVRAQEDAHSSGLFSLSHTCSLRSTLNTAYYIPQETEECSLYDPNLVCDKLRKDIAAQNKIIIRYENVQDGISVAILSSF